MKDLMPLGLISAERRRECAQEGRKLEERHGGLVKSKGLSFLYRRDGEDDDEDEEMKQQEVVEAEEDKV